MKKLIITGALLLATATLFAADVTKDVEAIKAADQKFSDDSQSGKAETWAKIWAPNGTKPAAGGKWIVGPDAVREEMAKSYARPGFKLVWHPVKAEVAAGGHLGYTFGRWTRELTKDGKPVKMEGDYLTVWEKQEDGSWKIVFDTGDVDPK